LNDIINHIEPKVIHFSQWSNKAYAIFNSIGKVVNIGFLSTIIQGIITVKSLISNEILGVFQEITEKDEFDDDSLNQLEITNLFDIITALKASTIKNCVECSELEHITINYIIRTKRALSGSFLFSGIYFSIRRLYIQFYAYRSIANL
jgi:hypothetical protein